MLAKSETESGSSLHEQKKVDSVIAPLNAILTSATKRHNRELIVLCYF